MHHNSSKPKEDVVIAHTPDPWYLRTWNTVKHPKVAPYLGIGVFIVISVIISMATLRPQKVTTMAAVHQAKLSILPDRLTLPPNGTLNVWATADAPLAFLDISVTFDPGVVLLATGAAVTTSSWGRVIQQTTMTDANASGKLELMIGWDPKIKGATPSGTFQIAVLQFKTNTATPGVTSAVTIAPSPLQLGAVDATVFTTTTGGSTLTVNPVPTTGVSPTRGISPTSPPSSNDTTPPVVTITSPTDGSAMSAKGNMAVKVTASDISGIATITIALDGTVVKTCSTATACQYNVNTGKLTGGSHTITATAMDRSTNKNTASTTIRVTK